MKASSFISTAALLGSVFAIFLASRHPQTPTQSDIDAKVDARLAARELDIVQGIAPKVRDMMAGVDDSKYGANWSPRTVDELLEPIVKVIAAMGEPTPSEQDPHGTEQTAPSVGDKPSN